MNMPFKNLVALILFFACIPILAAPSLAQTSAAQVRITQPIDESKLTVLHGNVHPLARPEFDLGAAPADLPMERMLLVLKRGPAQQAALDKLMAQQLDKSSPTFHKWLTPAQFGQQFGPADQDISTVTTWLQSHGFQIGNVSNGRTVIEFTGTAAQVQQTFHTAIHHFVVNGEDHWANVNDPAIPTALTPVVVGVDTLHDFHPRPMVKIKHAPKASVVGAVRPQVTITGTSACGLTSVTDCFDLGPADFAAIYNVQPLWNAGIDGTGQTIAIVTDSNINLADVSDFRSIFGLPTNPPTVTLNGSDPGKTGDEVEAILDVEWSGAVAKNATINLVVSKSTNSTFGGDLSATDIVNNKLAPILSESFGQCELGLGSIQNAFYNTTWQQAASEGITVIVSSGDNGAAACDVARPASPANCGFFSTNLLQLAQCGLAVNGIASTPFNVAVGGTEFNDVNDPLQFWSGTNAAGSLESALGYIPEMTYNDSCTSGTVVSQFRDGTAELACNDSLVQTFIDPTTQLGLVTVSGGGGGASNCTTFDGTNPTGCTGGYAKPCWQGGAITATCTQHSGINTPADGARDLPDISLFSGDGTVSGSAYILCERDLNGNNNNTACNVTQGLFLNVGGTSVATQVFAGIMALVDQKNEGKQGLINPVLYSLAATAGKTCTSSAANPPAACIFNDVTVDTIAMPCSPGTPNCSVANGGDQVGVLTGYNAGAGYDLATGLGSVNAAALVNASGVWTNTTSGNDFTISAGTPTPVASPGGTGSVTVTVAADGGFNGMVTFACSDLPSETTCSGQSVTGSGQSTIMFQTTAASIMTPMKPPAQIGLPGGVGTLALICVLSFSLMWFGFSNRNRRWSAVLAFVAMAVVFASVGCGGGGGGGGGGNPGTPTGTTNVVITATSGSISRSVSVPLTVN